MTKLPIHYGPSVQGPDGHWHRAFTQCPFGVRDLTSNECYSGSGRNRCPHFIRYENGDTIVCGHPPKQEPTLFDKGEDAHKFAEVKERIKKELDV